MKIVRVALDEKLVKSVDRVARRLQTSRSGFIREALKATLEKGARPDLERQHRRGYEAKPDKAGEFDVWLDEQMWPEWDHSTLRGSGKTSNLKELLVSMPEAGDDSDSTRQR